jgi:hypothetical protein
MSLGKLSPEAGVALLGLGSALRGQDPAQAVLGAQRVLEQRRLQEEQEQAYQSALQSANPDQQKLMKLLGPSGYSEYQKQIALKQLGLGDSKIFPKP